MDIDDLTKIFYEFNLVTYTAEQEDGKTMLHVNIENRSLDYMMSDYAFTDEQRIYADELLADKELWKKNFPLTSLPGMPCLKPVRRRKNILNGTGQMKTKTGIWHTLCILLMRAAPVKQ